MPSLELVGACDSAEALLHMVGTLQADVLLLDIHMPVLNGIDAAALLANPAPKIIFVTALRDYALRAFEVGAIDYVLKPVDPARLRQAIEQVQSAWCAPERLAITTNAGIALVDPNTISHAMVSLRNAQVLGALTLLVSACSDMIAVEAGVHALVHLPMLSAFSSAEVAELAGRGIGVVTTLAVDRNSYELALGTTKYDDPALADDVPPEVLGALRAAASVPASSAERSYWAERDEILTKNFAMALDAGVTIAAGTDSGIAGTLHGIAVHDEMAHGQPFISERRPPGRSRYPSEQRVAGEKSTAWGCGQVSALRHADCLRARDDAHPTGLDAVLHVAARGLRRVGSQRRERRQ
jgi:CheY-like chemotaxis protein